MPASISISLPLSPQNIKFQTKIVPVKIETNPMQGKISKILEILKDNQSK
jgi:hypothetical protein